MTCPPCLDGHYPASTLLRGSPPLTAHRYFLPCGWSLVGPPGPIQCGRTGSLVSRRHIRAGLAAVDLAATARPNAFAAGQGRRPVRPQGASSRSTLPSTLPSPIAALTIVPHTPPAV